MRSRLISKLAIATILVLVVGLLITPSKSQTPATQPPTPQWQIDAGGKMAFDVASVKQNKSGAETRSSNMLGFNAGPTFVPTGGLFTATNYQLINYIMFAYKLSNPQVQYEMSGLPEWASIGGERFDIEARAQGNPTKDQYRLMVQALLADRFKLAIRHETREASVLALTLLKNGMTGPQLQPHLQNETCSTAPTPGHGLGVTPGTPAPTSPSAPSEVSGMQLEPIPCGVVVAVSPSAIGRVRLGARNVTIEQIAQALGGDDLIDRPVINGTGLAGAFDFSLEWSQHITFIGPPPPDYNPDPEGPSLAAALQKQLGLKLEPRKAPMDFIVIDHLERPSPN